MPTLTEAVHETLEKAKGVLMAVSAGKVNAQLREAERRQRGER
jgi:hypothetical protein